MYKTLIFKNTLRPQPLKSEETRFFLKKVNLQCQSSGYIFSCAKKLLISQKLGASVISVFLAAQSTAAWRIESPRESLLICIWQTSLNALNITTYAIHPFSSDARLVWQSASAQHGVGSSKDGAKTLWPRSFSLLFLTHRTAIVFVGGLEDVRDVHWRRSRCMKGGLVFFKV